MATSKKRTGAGKPDLKRLASFPELNPNPVLEVDFAGTIVYANRAASTLFPDLPETGSDHPFLAGWSTTVAKLSGRPNRSVSREVKVNGRFYLQSFHIAPDSDAIRIFCMDITDRKLAEAALKDMSAKLERLVKERTQDVAYASSILETVFTNVDFLIAYLDKDFNFIRVNEGYAAADGKAPDFFPGKGHFDLFPNAENEAIFRRVVETGEPFHIYEKPFEYAGHPERGVTYWDWSLHPVKDAKGTVSGLVLTLVDRTQRHRAQEELYKAAYIIENAGFGVVISDPDANTFEFVNPEYAAQHGHKVEELVGKSIFGVYPPEEQATVRRVLKDLETKNHVAFESRHLKKNGSTFPVLVDVVLMRDTDGRPAHRVVFTQDITRLKDKDRALMESERQLRYLSAQLLLAQENERKRVARELHNSVGQTLTGLKLHVQNMMQQAEKNRLGTQKTSLDSLVPLIQHSVEEVRRIQMDLRPSMLDDFGIIPTIDWFVRSFQTTYPTIVVDKRIKIREHEVPDALKPVTYRILQEAMNNVAKHSKGDHVTITLARRDDSVELTIADNGRGFDLRKAYQDAGQRGSFGLTSMRERVQLSGGTYRIESKSGAGTKISAIWPAS